MLQREHSAILSTFIKLRFVIEIFVLSIFEWPFYTGFTVQQTALVCFIKHPEDDTELNMQTQVFIRITQDCVSSMINLLYDNVIFLYV